MHEAKIKPTLFLTGSTGFIGKHLLPKLTDYNVHCGGHNEVPDYIPDYIIHLAAVTTTSADFIPELFESNIVYAKKIMEIPTRIVYASSTSASELTNVYAYTKRYIEWLAKGKNATGLRFFNVYGNGNNKGLVKRSFDCARTGENVVIAGGTQIRDFIYIDDVVRVIIESLNSNEKIIEVGTGRGLSAWQIPDIISKELKTRIVTLYTDSVNTDMIYSLANPGISNCLSFREGIRKMLGK